MGKLSHLRSQKPTAMDAVSGFIGSLAQDIGRQVSENVVDQLTRNAHATEALQAQIAVLGPAIERGIRKALEDKDVTSQLTELTQEVKKRAITQADMVKLQSELVRALSNVKIPDYTDALMRLEQKQPDLSGVLKKIEGMKVEAPDPVTSWHFDVERNNEGLIRSITATAEG